MNLRLRGVVGAMASGHCLSHCLAHTCGPALRRWSLAVAARPTATGKSLGAIAGARRAAAALVQRRSAVSCSASSVSTAASVGVAVQGVTRNVVDVLQERGLIESVTSEELRDACMKQRLKVYCGFDPTAESLHLGNLLGIIVLSWFQRCVRAPLPPSLPLSQARTAFRSSKSH